VGDIGQHLGRQHDIRRADVDGQLIQRGGPDDRDAGEGALRQKASAIWQGSSPWRAAMPI
jgi:hypothetical protein